MIHYSGINDIARIYFTCQRDDVNYRLAYIEKDFPNEPHEQFDPTFMNALFNYAYQKARNGYPWLSAPPWMGGQELAPPAATSVTSAAPAQ